jgi:L-2,4-diaminobutyric acid acetyltransferase
MTAYRPPVCPAALFIWQVAVHESARRQGLAGRMLRNLLSRPACCGIRWLEATIGPSNQPSYAFFVQAASLLHAPMTQAGAFKASWLGEPVHEDEILYRIGPLPSAMNTTSTDGGTNANDQ